MFLYVMVYCNTVSYHYYYCTGCSCYIHLGKGRGELANDGTRGIKGILPEHDASIPSLRLSFAETGSKGTRVHVASVRGTSSRGRLTDQKLARVNTAIDDF